MTKQPTGTQGDRLLAVVVLTAPLPYSGFYRLHVEVHGTVECVTVFVTGDTGFYHEGQLCFAGRCDRQVQRRGCRVNPLQLENCLLEMPEVHTAAVVPCSNEETDSRNAAVSTCDQLVAVVVPSARHLPDTEHRDIKRRKLSAVATGPSPTLDSLSVATGPSPPLQDSLSASVWRALRAALPKHLLPDRIVITAGPLPLTRTGKVDIKALQVQVTQRTTHRTAGSGVTSPVDVVLMDVLGLPAPPSPHISLAELGVDSIQAARIAFKLFSGQQPPTFLSMTPGQLMAVRTSLAVPSSTDSHHHSSTDSRNHRPGSRVERKSLKHTTAPVSESDMCQAGAVVHPSGCLSYFLPLSRYDMDVKLVQHCLRSPQSDDKKQPGVSGVIMDWCHDLGACVDASPVVVLRKVCLYTAVTSGK